MLGANADCAVAVHGPVVVLLWRGKVVPEGARWMRRGFLKAREQPGRLALLTIVEDGCEIRTPPEVRDEVSEMLRLYGSRLAGAAIVFEGRGFKATMVRSIITAIYIASRAKVPNSVFGDVGTALQWLCRHDETLPDPAELQRVVDEMRPQ
ncbi:MAG: hypothetical protein PVI30_15670 [Myxococcales bacterium]|jgi:hypothetical protein